MLESAYKRKLINIVKHDICYDNKVWVVRPNSTFNPGYPDLIFLIDRMWMALEVKRKASAHISPLQNFLVEDMNSVGFARFVFPGNEKEVLDELQNYIKK